MPQWGQFICSLGRNFYQSKLWTSAAKKQGLDPDAIGERTV
jgi:hypothetical protein